MIVIDCSVTAAAVTVSAVDEEMPFSIAPIVVVPAATAEDMPALLMVAVLVFEELQATEPVTF